VEGDGPVVVKSVFKKNAKKSSSKEGFAKDQKGVSFSGKKWVRTKTGEKEGGGVWGRKKKEERACRRQQQCRLEYHLRSQDSETVDVFG